MNENCPSEKVAMSSYVGNAHGNMAGPCKAAIRGAGVELYFVAVKMNWVAKSCIVENMLSMYD